MNYDRIVIGDSKAAMMLGLADSRIADLIEI